MALANEHVGDPAAQPSLVDGPVQEDWTSSTFGDQLEVPGEDIDELEAQYSAKDQLRGKEATSESQLGDLRTENAEQRRNEGSSAPEAGSPREEPSSLRTRQEMVQTFRGIHAAGSRCATQGCLQKSEQERIQ